MSLSKATVIDAFGWFKDLIIAEVQENIDAIEPYSLPTASRWQKGGVMIAPDSGLVMSGDYLLATLPTASSSIKGGVKVGGGLSMSGDTLNCTIDAYTLPTASTTEKGGVKVGEGLSMDGETLNCTISSGTLDLVTHTQNGLMRATDKVKLDGIEGGAQVNAIERIFVNGTEQPITSKSVDLDLSPFVKKTEIASGVRMKGSLNYFADLPATAEVGDMYNIKNAGGVDSDGTPIEAGDNVVFTDKGTWDVMAGLIDLSGYARLTDIAGLSNYTLPTASATEKGGVMIGAGLSMAGDTLNVTVESYTLPTASTTEKGGVKIGTGLSMTGETLSATQYTLPTASTSTKGGVKVGTGLSMAGETLNCTVKGETYSEFTGATAKTSGAKGLVPAPKTSDQKNFLCGDGTWADPSRFVHVVIGGGGSATAASSSVSSIQGGLWQDLIDGVPCLKLRYGDYEYNFYYDTTNRTGDGSTPLDTTTKGVEYILSTVPSAKDGELWYEVTDNHPTLMVHKWVFDYGYNYDTITYKGSNNYLHAYLPFEFTTDDAIGTLAWKNTGAIIAPAPSGGNALKNTGIFGRTTTTSQSVVTLSGTGAWTIDFWFSVDLNTIPQNDTKYRFFYLRGKHSTNQSNYVYLYICNKEFVTNSKQCSITKTRTHIAINKPSKGAMTIYIDGKAIETITGATSELNQFQIFTNTAGAPPMYIDHFRIFKGQAVWDGDFTPPSPESYLE